MIKIQVFISKCQLYNILPNQFQMIFTSLFLNIIKCRLSTCNYIYIYMNLLVFTFWKYRKLMRGKKLQRSFIRNGWWVTSESNWLGRKIFLHRALAFLFFLVLKSITAMFERWVERPTKKDCWAPEKQRRNFYVATV